MLRYIAKRILWLIPVLLGVTLLIFTIMYFTPGDPAAIILGGDSTQQARMELAEEMGLNDSYFVQLGRYLKGIFLHFDFGTSYIMHTSVTAELMERFPRTLIIALSSILIAMLIGVPLGVTSAVHHNSVVDYISMFISLIGISMPQFWLALLLVILFAVQLGWLPPSGMEGPIYFILPCVANAVGGIAMQARQARSSVLEVIRADYIVTAKAKGQSEHNVIYKHALRNALIPIITVSGISFANLLGGALVIETIFSIPGIGIYMINGVNNRDYPVVEGSVIFLAMAFGIVMLIVDIIYAWVDPRIKAQYEAKAKAKKIRVKRGE